MGERAARTGRARRRATAAIGGLVVVGLVSFGAVALAERFKTTPSAVAHVSAPQKHRASAVRRVVPHVSSARIHPAARAKTASSRHRVSAKRATDASPSAGVHRTVHPAPAAQPHRPTPITTTPVTTKPVATTPVATKPTTTTTRATEPPPATTAPTADTRSIVDEFEGAQLATSVWWPAANRPDIHIAESHGAVTVDVPSTAGDNFNASVNTRCVAQGDFDARLSYRLLNWPGADGISVSLMAADIRGVNVYRSDDFGEVYGAWFPPAPGNTLPASDSHAVLRLVRTGATFTGYVGDGTTWTTISSGPGAISDTRISLAVFNIADSGAFAGRAATIAFDRFQLDADAIRC